MDIHPRQGMAKLFVRTPNRDGPPVERADLGGLLGGVDWQSVTVRAQGPKLWLLINDEVVLSAVGASQRRQSWSSRSPPPARALPYGPVTSAAAPMMTSSTE